MQSIKGERGERLVVVFRGYSKMGSDLVYSLNKGVIEIQKEVTSCVGYATIASLLVGRQVCRNALMKNSQILHRLYDVTGGSCILLGNGM